MDTLYAWVHPLDSDRAADHTWVTSYPTPESPYPDIGAVKNARQSYWYCAGSYHDRGDSDKYSKGLIAQVPAAVTAASCICGPNDERERGTIFKYGVDGLCHQVANQVLASAGRAAVTVYLARRYWFSSFFFGTYGRRQAAAWEQKKKQCGLAVLEFRPPADEFERHFYDVLGRYAEIDPLSSLRDRAGKAIDAESDKLSSLDPAAAARRLNALINEHLRELALKVGGDEYQRVFGEPPGSELELVDPEAMERSKSASLAS